MWPINSNVDAVFTLDHKFYQGTILAVVSFDDEEDMYRKVQFDDGMIQITHIDFIRQINHSLLLGNRRNCDCCTLTGLIFKKLTKGRSVHREDVPIDDPNFVLKTASSFFVKGGKISNDVVPGATKYFQRNNNKEISVRSSLLENERSQEEDVLTDVITSPVSVSSVMVNSSPLTIIPFSVNSNEMSSLEIFLSERFPDFGVSFWSLIQKSVVEPLRKEISDCKDTIRILQEKVISQQEELISSSNEKKLSNEILLNLQTELVLLKEKVIFPMSYQDNHRNANVISDLDAMESNQDHLSDPDVSLNKFDSIIEEFRSDFRPSNTSSPIMVASQDVSSSVTLARKKQPSKKTTSAALSAKVSTETNTMMKNKSSSHRHVIVRNVESSTCGSDLKARIQEACKGLEIKVIEGKFYSKNGKSFRSAFISVQTTPIRPNVDMILSSAKNWSMDSWSVDKFRSWNEYQKVKNTDSVNSFVKRIQSINPATTDVQELRELIDKFLPSQKFGSNKNTIFGSTLTISQDYVA